MRFLGDGALPPALRESAPMFVFALLNGLAVGRAYEAPGHEAPVLDLMKQLGASLLGASMLGASMLGGSK